MYRANPCHPDRLAQANRFFNLIHNKQTRDYGFRYLAWLRNCGIGPEPRTHPKLSAVGAAAVRAKIGEFRLWDD